MVIHFRNIQFKWKSRAQDEFIFRQCFSLFSKGSSNRSIILRIYKAQAQLQQSDMIFIFTYRNMFSSSQCNWYSYPKYSSLVFALHIVSTQAIASKTSSPVKSYCFSSWISKGSPFSHTCNVQMSLRLVFTEWLDDWFSFNCPFFLLEDMYPFILVF
jgi:hypothetical protein